ncbi:MAG: Lipase [Gemmatimonadetes bacterium]|nr:Lipase [Gemmatimonadota bacterium]
MNVPSLAAWPRPAQRTAAPQPDTRELVFTLHGLGRTPLSMAMLARSLEADGFRVANWGYSSTAATIPQIGAALAAEVRAQAGAAPRIHFVGHSLGNIVVRWMLAHDPPPDLPAGRVVMLAPPNQGSRAADRFAPWLGWFLRPLAELRTADGTTVRALPPPEGLDVGVIAGSYDGKVSVDEAHLAGAHHAVVPAMHSFLMNRRDVRALVTRFLRTGTFEPAESPAAG